jgi:two-component system invasion response regulator UvrY
MSDVRSADFSMAFPGAGDLGSAPANPARILVVDDDSHVGRTLLDVLSQNGFQGTRADSGEAALEMLAKSAYDLVLLDVRMPGIGGVEAARRIMAAHPETVVVLISIEDSAEFSEDAHSCGVAAFVRKQDFGPKLLRSIWETHGALRGSKR